MFENRYHEDGLPVESLIILHLYQKHSQQNEAVAKSMLNSEPFFLDHLQIVFPEYNYSASSSPLSIASAMESINIDLNDHDVIVEEANSIYRLLQIRAANYVLIDKMAGLVGSACGYKWINGKKTDHPAVIIFVEQKNRTGKYHTPYFFIWKDPQPYGYTPSHVPSAAADQPSHPHINVPKISKTRWWYCMVDVTAASSGNKQSSTAAVTRKNELLAQNQDNVQIIKALKTQCLLQGGCAIYTYKHHSATKASLLATSTGCGDNSPSKQQQQKQQQKQQTASHSAMPVSPDINDDQAISPSEGSEDFGDMGLDNPHLSPNARKRKSLKLMKMQQQALSNASCASASPPKPSQIEDHMLTSAAAFSQHAQLLHPHQQHAVLQHSRSLNAVVPNHNSHLHLHAATAELHQRAHTPSSAPSSSALIMNFSPLKSSLSTAAASAFDNSSTVSSVSADSSVSATSSSSSNNDLVRIYGTIGTIVEDENQELCILTNLHVAKHVGNKLYITHDMKYIGECTKVSPTLIDDDEYFDKSIDHPCAKYKLDSALVKVVPEMYKFVKSGLYWLGSLENVVDRDEVLKSMDM